MKKLGAQVMLLSICLVEVYGVRQQDLENEEQTVYTVPPKSVWYEIEYRFLHLSVQLLLECILRKT